MCVYVPGEIDDRLPENVCVGGCVLFSCLQFGHCFRLFGVVEEEEAHIPANNIALLLSSAVHCGLVQMCALLLLLY